MFGSNKYSIRDCFEYIRRDCWFKTRPLNKVLFKNICGISIKPVLQIKTNQLYLLVWPKIFALLKSITLKIMFSHNLLFALFKPNWIRIEISYVLLNYISNC